MNKFDKNQKSLRSHSKNKQDESLEKSQQIFNQESPNGNLSMNSSPHFLPQINNSDTALNEFTFERK